MDGRLGSEAVACIYRRATEELCSVFLEFVFRDDFNLFNNLLIHLAAYLHCNWHQELPCCVCKLQDVLSHGLRHASVIRRKKGQVTSDLEL
jgi:hypothetical protein